MKNKHLLDVIGEIDERYIVQAAPAAKKSRRKPGVTKWSVMAACALFVILAGLGSFAVVAEIREYNAALSFFDEYDMSTEGLTRYEIKAVYRDITTKSFTYSKTGEVIRSSIKSEVIGGFEISQDTPSPEDVENLWNYKNHNGMFFENSEQEGVHYVNRSENKKDPTLGFDVFDKSYIEKYDKDTLLWSVSVSDFLILDYSIVSDGIIAYGKTYTWSSEQTSYAWIMKIDTEGNIVFKNKSDSEFENEYITAVVENSDGSYAVFSRGDFKYFCLRQYTACGEETMFRKTEVGNCGIKSAVRFEDGYLMQLYSYISGEQARIVKVDYEGNITDSFSYSNGENYYYITDMTEYNGNIYLSAYAYPRRNEDNPNAYGRGEISEVLDYLFHNNISEISSDELTPMIRDIYTAMLLVCEPNEGEPKEYYSVKGSLGGKLSLDDSGNLLWDVESITRTFYSPYTSSFTIGGTSYVYRYTFDNTGLLISQEKTGEIVDYRR